MKDGRPASSSASVLFDSGRESSVVVFKPVAVEDVGNYTCRVKNAYGTDSFTARLVVKCKCGDLFQFPEVAVNN